MPAVGAAWERRGGLAGRAGRRALAGRRRICDNRTRPSPDRGGPVMATGTLSVGDLTRDSGDTAASGQHRAGYNGIWSLTHKTQDTTIFVPAVAGMNLEHIYDGATLDAKGETKIFFEPRNAKMTFKKVSGHEAELHQPPTPTFKLESWTTFTLRKPDIIDFAFQCKPT